MARKLGLVVYLVLLMLPIYWMLNMSLRMSGTSREELDPDQPSDEDRPSAGTGR